MEKANKKNEMKKNNKKMFKRRQRTEKKSSIETERLHYANKGLTFKILNFTKILPINADVEI